MFSVQEFFLICFLLFGFQLQKVCQKIFLISFEKEQLGKKFGDFYPHENGGKFCWKWENFYEKCEISHQKSEMFFFFLPKMGKQLKMVNFITKNLVNLWPRIGKFLTKFQHSQPRNVTFFTKQLWNLSPKVIKLHIFKPTKLSFPWFLINI